MTIIKNIGELAGIVPEGVLRKEGEAMDELVSIKGAFLTVEGSLIGDFGPMEDCPAPGPGDKVITAEGGIVMPAFCDSHTHICYAGGNGLWYVIIAEEKDLHRKIRRLHK